MKMLTWFILSMVALGARAGADPVPKPDQAAAQFPTLKAANLEKRELSLPRDFAGDPTLVLIAFEREQQRDVDTWLREMKRFEELNPAFRYYELPVIQRPNALTRWFIDSGMRRGISDRKARERTITLYIDKKPFCDTLLIADQKRIYALLLDRAGKVLWRAEGIFDEAKGASLREKILGKRQ